MATRLLASNPPDVREASLAEAAMLLRAGRTVAFPTETVYGLGADATSEEAVARIFEAKGRPATNPLIIHLAQAREARRWTRSWPRSAELLSETFWPGPLTLILPVDGALAKAALAGGDTVGLRVPAHPLATELLERAGVPIAAPSANRSNSVSPTSAQAVLDSLDGRIDAVLDGGECAVGIESTVLDLSGAKPRILRPGMISRRELSAALREEVLAGPAAEDSEGPVRSPGLLPRHYSPAVPLLLVASPERREGDFIVRLGAEFHASRDGVTLPDRAKDFASKLYFSLWLGEKSGAARIVFELPPDGAEWEAIHDRLKRAATPP